MTFNPRAREELGRFRSRPDTFSLGVCNGCQLLALLGWVGGDPTEEQEESGHGSPPTQPGLLLRHNLSGRFESRWATVRVEPGPALMLRGMEGSVLPVWSAHGEGQAGEGGAGVRAGAGPEEAWLSLAFVLCFQVTWHFLLLNSKPRSRPGAWFLCTGQMMMGTPQNSTP